jgi:hypothetical protein
MSRVPIVVGLLAIVAIGFLRITRTLQRLAAERSEVEAYIEVFTRFFNSRGADGQAYGELLERSLRIQELLGDVGIMSRYVAPFGRLSVPNYAIILNGVPAARRDFEATYSGRSDHGQLVGETLVRYMGWSADRINKAKVELRNPAAWLREGVAAMLLVPLWLLRSFGLLSSSRSDDISDSVPFRVLTGLVAVIGLVASVFEIVLGWSAMKEMAITTLDAWR